MKHFTIEAFVSVTSNSKTTGNSAVFSSSFLFQLVRANISDTQAAADYALLPATVSWGKAFQPQLLTSALTVTFSDFPGSCQVQTQQHFLFSVCLETIEVEWFLIIIEC